MTRLMSYMEVLESFDVEIKESDPIQSAIQQLQIEGAKPETIKHLINCIATTYQENSHLFCNAMTYTF